MILDTLVVSLISNSIALAEDVVKPAEMANLTLPVEFI